MGVPALKAKISTAAVLDFPVSTDESAETPPDRSFNDCNVRASASQSRTSQHKSKDQQYSIDPGVQSAAAVESMLKSVRREIKEDLAEMLEDGSTRPTDRCISRGMEVAREIALRFHKQTWVDVAGFVASGGRIAVLAHSMETGRRVTFYTDDAGIRAIQTSVSGEPISSEPENMEMVRSVLDWITHID